MFTLGDPNAQSSSADQKQVNIINAILYPKTKSLAYRNALTRGSLAGLYTELPTSVVASCIQSFFFSTFYSQTPLHLASYGGYPHCIKLLLDHGADMSMTNDKRVTAYDLAKGKVNCEKVFQQSVEKLNIPKRTVMQQERVEGTQVVLLCPTCCAIQCPTDCLLQIMPCEHFCMDN